MPFLPWNRSQDSNTWACRPSAMKACVVPLFSLFCLYASVLLFLFPSFIIVSFIFSFTRCCPPRICSSYLFLTYLLVTLLFSILFFFDPVFPCNLLVSSLTAWSSLFSSLLSYHHHFLKFLLNFALFLPSWGVSSLLFPFVLTDQRDKRHTMARKCTINY